MARQMPMALPKTRSEAERLGMEDRIAMTTTGMWNPGGWQVNCPHPRFDGDEEESEERKNYRRGWVEAHVHLRSIDTDRQAMVTALRAGTAQRTRLQVRLLDWRRDGTHGKIGAIKVIRRHLVLGLKEAKYLVESVPVTIEVPTLEQWQELRKDLWQVGATTETAIGMLARSIP